ncbi:HWE histidine kinase domain-containing protein [Lichenibacterium minor]|uniref:HWE histidine kinase domain-containing protein n=1 Tax=Lichenibacterium minor TaxID=2316528 RepID=UPI0013EB67AD|nr:HWE histidine kinase domain-containing protein [Lichenibacterium minor]
MAGVTPAPGGPLALPLFWRADASGGWVWCCAAWTSRTGLSGTASAGDGWVDAVHPEDRALALAPWGDRDDAGCRRARLRIRSRGDGRYHPVQPVAASARDPAGGLREWIGTLGPASPPEPRRPDGELQHYLRNALSVIRSVARRTALTSDSVEHYATHFEGRIDALARVQVAVIRSPWGGVDLESLIGEELLAHRVRDVVVEGPAVTLKARAAESLGLAVHELVINAVKFGAFSSPRGAVSVLWTVGPGPRLHLTWCETGIVAVSLAPRRSGFGTELIERGLPYDLGATTRIRIEPGRLVCGIEMPLTAETALGEIP